MNIYGLYAENSLPTMMALHVGYPNPNKLILPDIARREWDIMKLEGRNYAAIVITDGDYCVVYDFNR